MYQLFTNPLVAGASGIFLSCILTYIVRNLAHRYGFVAKPKNDRWHKTTTAMMGGVAIFLSTFLLYLVFVPKNFELFVIMGASSLLFAVGLIDDLLNIKPYQKLIGQLAGAIIVIGFGLKMPLTGIELLDIGITVFWLIGITNAVNLLDNMDGLATGIAAIAAISLTIGLILNGQTSEALIVAVFVGSLLGFLIFNFNPASVFMGDCGSMFIGFLLASSVLLSDTGGRSRGVFSILAVPALILLVPIFDTTLVTILRKMWGRKASQGGRDHTSHRLVALGLSERSAVLMLYAFAAAAGALSLFVSHMQLIESAAAILVFIIVLVIIGVYLSKVKVYEEDQEDLAIKNNAAFSFLVDVSYKRRIFEVVLDVFLITLSYFAAYNFLFGSFDETEGNWTLFIRTLPMLVFIKLSTFLLAGVYRGVWRYTSIGDLITFAKAIGISSALSILVLLMVYRFENFSRGVFILDALILFLMLAGSRMAFRVIRELLPITHVTEGRRVLIYGAGDGGELVLRELRNNPHWNFQPVGFVDDDHLKTNKVIGGLKVFEIKTGIADICREKNVQEILISFRDIEPDKMSEIKEICREARVELKKAYLNIEPVAVD